MLHARQSQKEALGDPNPCLIGQAMKRDTMSTDLFRQQIALEPVYNWFISSFPISSQEFAPTVYPGLLRIATGHSPAPTVSQFFLSLPISRTAARRIYRELQEAGFIEVLPSPDDNRVKFIHTTDRFDAFMQEQLTQWRNAMQALEQTTS